MGTLSIGDVVFDENGQPCRVTDTFDHKDLRCFRLTLSGGETVVCDESHLWVTWDHQARKQFQRYENHPAFPENWPVWEGSLYDSWGNKAGRYGPQIRTPDEIADTFRHGGRKDKNHSIPLCLPLNLPEADVFDPWVFGYWLGNGSKKSVCAGSYDGNSDADYVESHMKRCRIDYTRGAFDKGSTVFNLRGFPTWERGVIPTEYKRSSIEQRTALIRGLMDSDGHPDKAKVEFCSIVEGLAWDVYEVLCSLGERPYFQVGNAMLNGRFISKKYRVFWKPTLFNPFGLPRKAEKCDVGAKSLRTRQRMIENIEEVQSVPTRCIKVDSPNSMFLCGSGMIPTHNTRTAAEDCAHFACQNPNTNTAVIAATANDLRRTMLEGISGIIRALPEGSFIYNRGFGEIRLWNGSTIFGYSAEEPDRMRGPNFHRAYADELASWSRAIDTWDMLNFALRLGDNPQCIITTTPRPTPILIGLVKDASGAVFLTKGNTYENSDNLSPKFLEYLKNKYEGTRLGRQELAAELLEDTVGALWRRSEIEEARVREAPEMLRIVVAIDPAVSNTEGSDETGIIAAGKGVDGRFYVLADASGKYSPEGWANEAVALYHRFKADRIIGEVNNGGDMIENILRNTDRNVSYKAVRASRGKVTRAEPIAALYEQKKVSHVGCFPTLEDQQSIFTSDYDRVKMRYSPDRVDALVWALTELGVETAPGQNIQEYWKQKEARIRQL